MIKLEPLALTTLSRICLITLALPLLAACGDEKQKPAVPPLSVLAEKVTVSSFAPKVQLTGEVQARVQSNLSFLIAGKVVERKVGVGDHVKAGQVIARLDPVEKQADVRAAEAAVTASQAVLTQASANFDRVQSLLDRQVATRKDFDAAQESLQKAQAGLDVSRTQLETAREMLAYTALTAARDGIVTSSLAEVGQVAQPGQTIFTIAEDGPRDAVFFVDEGAFANDDLNVAISVTSVADPAATVSATVREVSPAVDATTGTIRVKVELKNPPPAMAIGSSVVGQASLPAREVMSLPAGALFSLGGNPAVWIVDSATGAVSLKPIKVGAYVSDRILIESGLAEGETVVTRGGQMLHPGQIVKTVEGSAT